MDHEADQPFEQEQGARGETVRILTKGTKVFKRYTLIRPLGRGGMGVVWLARDEELERDVALKFLPETVCHDKEAAAELKRETRRSLDLTHPNIVRTHDFVHDDNRAAIAMEYVDGRSLSVLKTQREAWCFEVNELAPYIQQLCAALDYAHSVGRVVHQDLKPANLMVNSKGQLKVTDFGIARSIADSVTRITAEDTVGGTLVFMSPQQLNGEKASPANDIYSLGATIYDLLTSKPPFHTGSLHHQILENIPSSMTERRKELEIVGDEIPPAWEQTVAACLAKKPEDRPASAADVAQRLGLHYSRDPNWITGLPGRQFPAKGFKALKPATLAAILTLVLLASVISVLTFKLFNRRTENASIGVGSASTPETSNEEPISRPAAKAQLNMSELGSRFTNSLGMVFVRIEGLEDTFFCIWETRVRDFKAFVDDTRYDATASVTSMNEAGQFGDFGKSWKDPGWDQTESHPAVGLNRPDCQAFCRWLTELERSLGKVPVGLAYRLPTDLEWSVAAGLKDEPGNNPAERSRSSRGVYPWGGDWPPPSTAGNYAMDDPFHYTAPVGSFIPNSSGLYDMGGNAWEWCSDDYDDSVPPPDRRGVLRGASFVQSSSVSEVLYTSARRDPQWSKPMKRHVEMGFRCVLARPVSGQAPKPQALDIASFDDVSKPRVLPSTFNNLAKGRPWENSLGMQFVPVANVGFSIWETRVRDFATFVKATGYDASAKVRVFTASGWGESTNSWKDPGFPQTDVHPVTCVSWIDAASFCTWLTQTERKAGRLRPNQRYRLPTTAEWTTACGDRRYPWGNTWPPDSRVANIAGIEVIGPRWPLDRNTIADYSDGFAFTAPVGSFPANDRGIFDLSGNVWEWGLESAGSDRRYMRGAAWDQPEFQQLRCEHALPMPVTGRNTTTGFRCVLEELTNP